jgi:radical SAM superfamily enzyme YgiQ (UPF0313 family)
VARQRLLIIQPTFYRMPSNGNGSSGNGSNGSGAGLYKTRSRSLIGLTLPYLAALTPREWDVELVDEQITDIDFGADVDLVAITTWTLNSYRAYDIARRFRDRKIPVILGGPHTFFHAEEAVEHCDAVAAGEGEDVWPEMLADAAAGRLRKIYRASRFHPLEGLPHPRYDLMRLPRRRFFKTFSVQFSRGCPFKCEFCSERFYIGEQYRSRPPQEVVEEIRAIGARNVFFADSMFAGKRSRTMELMEALIPLRIRWSTLWTTYICRDDEFMDLAARSGLLHVNMGMESISQETLAAMNKKFNKVDQYDEILSGLRNRGISYSLNFVFGFDGENSHVFPATLQFLERHKVPVAYFYILSPHKGTPLYERMKQEGRLINPEEIRRNPGNICDIKPSYTSPEELERSVQRLYDEFYAIPSMVRRLPMPLTKANIASWFLNFSQRRMRHAEQHAQQHEWA